MKLENRGLQMQKYIFGNRGARYTQYNKQIIQQNTKIFVTDNGN